MSERANVPSFSTAAQGAIASSKVGPSERQYLVHKEIICHSSACFERAIKIREEETVCISDTEPGTFNIFVDWLYTCKLPKNDRDWAKVAETAAPSSSIQAAMLKAVVFGHQYAALTFHAAVHNEVVNRLIELRTAFSDLDVIYLFERLPADHPLLELVVELDFLYRTESWPTWSMGFTGLPPQFLVRAKARWEESKDGSEKSLTACDFHVHGSDEERRECQGEDSDRWD